MPDVAYEQAVRYVKLYPFDKGLVMDCVRYDWGLALRINAVSFYTASVAKRQTWLEQLFSVREYVTSRGVRTELEMQ